ncbi:hypothetical protein BDY24DRAFT_378685 [Mrakia frigida]|uniref:uncharacterized protein n=1 Tax=Mrakia frigida TaxID=29902 RepID=UPI003FCC10C2
MTASRPVPSTSTPPSSQQLHPGIDLNPSTGASILQAHLEACFKRGQLSDVKVRVDRFGREYRLHKVVLAQAAFFSSLFTGGWSEEEGSVGRAQHGGGGGGGPTLVEPAMGVTSSDGGREINLQMDDPNISRAAFEIILSRLYGTGPPLFVYPTTHPTPLHPLSPSFSLVQTASPSSSSNLPPPLCPDQAQPATPRFLLSLLATSLFLGLPGVTQGVLGLVIGSMSPWSVGVYLGFAIGKGVGGWGGEEWEAGGEDGEIEEKGGRGLEDLGVRVEESVVDEEEVLEKEKEGGKSGGGGRSSASKEGVKTESPSTSEFPSSSPTSSVHPTDRPSTPTQSNSTPSKPLPSRASLRTTSSSSSLASSRISALRDDDASSAYSREQPLFFYGLTSNRIGEACACWLARWGVDILAVEEKLYLAAKRNEKVAAGGLARGGRPSVDASQSKGKSKSSTYPASPSSYFPFIPESASSNSTSSPSSRPPRQPLHPHHHHQPSSSSSLSTDFPPIFSLGGLPATWLRAVISSDAFFVKNEMERYRVAKRVYDLRRSQREAMKKEMGGGEERRGSFETESEMEEGEKEEEEEEAEFDELFAKGIYYSHMTFEELAIISHDINPSTSLPYAPLAILQTSNWSQQELKTRILSSASPISSNLSSSPNSSTSSDLASAASAELGISSSTTGIVHDLGKVLEREARRRRRSRSVSQSASSPYGGGSPSGSRPFGSVSSISPYGGTPTNGGSPSAPLSPLGAGTSSPTNTSSFSALSLLPPISSSPSIADTKLYWPVPVDDTHRIGDYGGFLPLPSSGLATTGSTPLGAVGAGGAGVGGGKKSSGAAGERDFFGVGKGWRSGREILEGDLGVGNEGAGGEAMWTKYEPFRFSVEFWGVDKLKEKQREYSNTVFYAGSYFNVYAQTIKKKDRQIQLGIYLHRQSMLEPTPLASAPPVSAATPTNANPLTSSQSPASPPGSTAVLSTSAPTTNSSHLNHIPISRSLSGTSTPVTHSPSISPPSAASSGFSMGSGVSTPATVPSASFRDPRKVIKCYFSISCPSALGTALTRFASAPDVFSVSQSWGWKSQSLRSEEYLSVLPSLKEMKENIEDGVMGWTGMIDEATFGKLQSLRATVSFSFRRLSLCEFALSSLALRNCLQSMLC